MKRVNKQAPKGRATAVSRASSTVDEYARNLVRSVLDMVPVDDVIEVLKEYVIGANQEDQMLAALTLSGERAKPRIERASGPSWSTEEAARAIGKSAETVRTHVHNGKLVGYLAVGDQTRLRIPRWQFDRESAVHAWVPQLLSAYRENGWPLLDFMTVQRTQLDQQNYLHLLLAGRVDEVIRAAKRAQVD